MQYQIGKILLTQKDDISKIEFVFNKGINLERLLHIANPAMQIKESDEELSEEYIAAQLDSSDLPILIKKLNTYYCAKSHDGKALLFWNVNHREGYANLSIRNTILRPLLSTVTLEDGATKDVLAIQEWIDEAEGATGMKHTPEMNLAARLAFELDCDTRFSGTQRVRLTSTTEVDAVLDLLIPQIELFAETE